MFILSIKTDKYKCEVCVDGAKLDDEIKKLRCELCYVNNCKNCKGNKAKCQECNIGYKPDYYKKKCIKTLCNLENCLGCISENNCTKCSEGYVKFNNNTFCSKCDVPFCSECPNYQPSVCNKCIKGYDLVNNIKCEHNKTSMPCNIQNCVYCDKENNV